MWKLMLILLAFIATSVLSNLIWDQLKEWKKNKTFKWGKVSFPIAKIFPWVFAILLVILLYSLYQQIKNENALQENTQKALDFFLLKNDFNCGGWLNINNYQYEEEFKKKNITAFAIFKHGTDKERSRFPELNFHVGEKWFSVGGYEKSISYYEASEKILLKTSDEFLENFFRDNYNDEQLRDIVAGTFPTGAEKTIAENTVNFSNYKEKIFDNNNYSEKDYVTIENTRRIICDKNFYLYRIQSNIASCYAKLNKKSKAKKWAEKAKKTYKEVNLPTNEEYPHNSIKDILTKW